MSTVRYLFKERSRVLIGAIERKAIFKDSEVLFVYSFYADIALGSLCLFERIERVSHAYHPE